MAQFSFDTNTAPKSERSFELLPLGWYNAQITESEIVPLSSGKGQALKLTFEVLTDGYRNRKVWARLNIRHSESPEAERIANEQLRELCESIGIVRMQDTVELHNKPVQIRVKIREDKTGKYDPSNEVSGFKPVAGGAAAPMAAQVPGAAPRPSAPPAAANAPAAGSTPPWAKKAA